jgi:HEAT repeats
VELFHHDAETGRDQIRGLLEQAPQQFQDGVVRVMKSTTANARGVQFMVGLLAGSDSMIPTLCDPALNLEEAVSLARMALQLDPTLDAVLAKKLADATAQGAPIRNAGRLMDILGRISSGSRITSSLMRLWRSSDPQMRSKAVLLIGRGSRNIQWAQSRLAETDPRLRANAVEALWGADTAEAKEFLRAAAGDGHNRVAGNALLALYRMGDTWVVPELFKMAAADSPLFRSTAAWAMGETADPRFSETLARMVGETNAIVRKRAFLELSRLKAAAKMRQGRQWLVAARLLPESGGLRQLRLEAIPKDGGPLPRLFPTQFILSIDGQPVTHYQVEDYAPPQTLAVTFLFPHTTHSTSPWVQGAIESLNRKRPSDLWTTVFYQPADGVVQETPEPAQFTADRQTAAAALQVPPEQSLCLPFWDAIRTAVQAANAPEGGVRHLIVYNQSSPEAPEDLDAIVSAAVDSNTSVDIISLTPCPPLEELCRGTEGIFHLAPSPVELSKLVDETYRSLLARFLVSYQPTADAARALTVRVFDPTGWGETTLPL